jgi:DNA-directed RNA polymerase specialized sigma24 family protein
VIAVSTHTASSPWPGLLRYVEDHSIESVARLLNASPAAVKSLNTRALAQLRELLGTDQDLLRS